MLYVQDGLRGSPRAVLDPNRISPDGSTAVRDYAVSPGGRLLAYVKSRGGSGVGETRVRDIATGGELRESVPGTLTAVCWTQDARGFFSIRAPARRPEDAAGGARIEKQLFYHVLGQPPSRDRLIHEWKDNARWAYCMLSADGRRAVAVAELGLENELYTMDLGDPKRPIPALRSSGFSATERRSTRRSTSWAHSLRAHEPRGPRARRRLDLTETNPRPRTILPESSR